MKTSGRQPQFIKSNSTIPVKGVSNIPFSTEDPLSEAFMPEIDEEDDGLDDFDLEISEKSLPKEITTLPFTTITSKKGILIFRLSSYAEFQFKFFYSRHHHK